MPSPSKIVIGVGEPDADSNAAVSRYHFEDHVENAECDGIGQEVACLDHDDNKYRSRQPPHVVRQLSLDLLLFGKSIWGQSFASWMRSKEHTLMKLMRESPPKFVEALRTPTPCQVKV